MHNKVLIIICFLVSLVMCSLGQLTNSIKFNILSAALGIVPILYGLLQISCPKMRFWYGTTFFTFVQMIQLDWMIAHPFLYIYAVYFLLCLGCGLQFGLLSTFVTYNNLKNWRFLLFAPSFWVVMEWLRYKLMSGYSWNLIGLPLAAHTYSLQFASIAGALGLSFWVVLSALLLLRKQYILWVIAVVAPYAFGYASMNYHLSQENTKSLTVLLVQPAFKVDRYDHSTDYMQDVLRDWKSVLDLTALHKNDKVDMVALPEFVFPFGTYGAIYPYEKIRSLFANSFQTDDLAFLPNPKPPFGDGTIVTNGFIAQALSNYFNASVVIGLEDSEEIADNESATYTAAMHFTPEQNGVKWPPANRYAKRVLVPMGEYIPFDWCADIAKAYGIGGSFKKGEQAAIFKCNDTPFSPSICYEETFGSLTREGPQQGAELIVNITNDGWFPHSNLAKKHLEHARLRTVEGGVPLVRACNTGVTCSIDSFGQTIDELPYETSTEEAKPGTLLTQVPLYHYFTPYKTFGDSLILSFSLFGILLGTRFLRRY